MPEWAETQTEPLPMEVLELVNLSDLWVAQITTGQHFICTLASISCTTLSCQSPIDQDILWWHLGDPWIALMALVIQVYWCLPHWGVYTFPPLLQRPNPKHLIVPHFCLPSLKSRCFLWPSKPRKSCQHFTASLLKIRLLNWQLKSTHWQLIWEH